MLDAQWGHPLQDGGEPEPLDALVDVLPIPASLSLGTTGV